MDTAAIRGVSPPYPPRVPCQPVDQVIGPFQVHGYRVPGVEVVREVLTGHSRPIRRPNVVQGGFYFQVRVFHLSWV